MRSEGDVRRDKIESEMRRMGLNSARRGSSVRQVARRLNLPFRLVERDIHRIKKGSKGLR